MQPAKFPPLQFLYSSHFFLLIQQLLCGASAIVVEFFNLFPGAECLEEISDLQKHFDNLSAVLLQGYHTMSAQTRFPEFLVSLLYESLVCLILCITRVMNLLVLVTSSDFGLVSTNCTFIL